MIHCPELSEENVVRYWQMNHNTMSTACKKYSTRLTKLWCRDGKGGGGGGCGEHNLDLKSCEIFNRVPFFLFF